MEQVFDLIFNIFEYVVIWLNQIPVFGEVSLFDFSIGIIVMSIIIVAFVPSVSIGSTDFVTNTLHEREAARLKNERDAAAIDDMIYNRSYEKYKSDRERKERFNRQYNDERKK